LDSLNKFALLWENPTDKFEMLRSNLRSLHPMPQWQELLCAIEDQQPVTGLTHNFYRYPARFSPTFARQVILAFSKPGDLVFDPFMGGGTTLVEARALGRRAAGTDISSLAVFLTDTKTSVFSPAELRRIQSWARRYIPKINLHAPAARRGDWEDAGYHRNIDDRKTWAVRKMVQVVLNAVSQFDGLREQKLVRCALLRTAQWALDCREDVPPVREVRARFVVAVDEMVEGARQFARAAREGGCTNADSLCLLRSAVGVEDDPRITELGHPALILTSPPYPGVHVLYHRWQVLGRRETPAPFWIAGTLDGAGASYYTFGDRKNVPRYYEVAREAFASVARVSNRKTVVAQMVAFSEPEWQLPSYLEVMQDSGFKEISFPELANRRDGRVWRSVPNRKWYADKMGATAGSKEVVLFHKLA
jgi:hypothetical protein